MSGGLKFVEITTPDFGGLVMTHLDTSALGGNSM